LSRENGSSDCGWVECVGVLRLPFDKLRVAQDDRFWGGAAGCALDDRGDGERWHFRVGVGLIWDIRVGGGGEWGDGGDEAVDFVVDDFVDEGGGRRGGGVGFEGGFAGEQLGDELQIVKEFAGAGGVDVVGGDELEDAGGGGQGGGSIFDEREVEGLGLVGVAGFAGDDFGAASGVVVVAEALVAEGGRAALGSGGVEVAATVAGLGDGDELGLVLHRGTPLGVCCEDPDSMWFRSGSRRLYAAAGRVKCEGPTHGRRALLFFLNSIIQL
jgi:hypothetical protein